MTVPTLLDGREAWTLEKSALRATQASKIKFLCELNVSLPWQDKNMKLYGMNYRCSKF
jgi:hypothetical protein